MRQSWCSYIAVLLFSLLLSGCLKQENVFYIKSSPKEISIGKDGGVETVQVEGNTGWKVIIPEPWCVANLHESNLSFKPVSLVLSVKKNTKQKERQQKITLQSKAFPAVHTVITVVQEAGDGSEDPEEPDPTGDLVVTFPSSDIWCKEGTFDLSVWSLTNWSFVESDQTWCRLVTEQSDGGPGSYVLSFFAEASKLSQPRTALLTFKTAADSIVQVPITQRAVGLSIPEDLVAFRDDTNAGLDLSPWMDVDSIVHLRADIDMSAVENWIPIGVMNKDSVHGIKGVFDGNGYRISHLTITHSDLPSVGLFGHIQDAEVRNVVLDETCLISVAADGNQDVSVGGICGTLEGGVLSGCSFEGTVKVNGTGTKTYAGGIAGTLLVYDFVDGIILRSISSSVKHCSNAGRVIGMQVAGGIVGRLYGKLNKGNVVSYSENRAEGRVVAENLAGGISGLLMFHSKIEDCTNNGVVEATVGHAGGICAELSNSSSVSRCKNTSQASVQGNLYVGGICGSSMTESSITECTNSAAVRGVKSVGGISGVQMDRSTINSCTNTGDITFFTEKEEYNESVAGIVGISFNSTISSCENEGPVTGVSTAGGIVGYFSSSIYASCNVDNCSNTALVQGGHQTGGIVGMLLGLRSSLIQLTNRGGVTSHQKDASVGGIAGVVQGSTVEVMECENKQEAFVHALKGNAGGIAGNAPERGVQFSYCENHADVRAGKWAAGIVAITKDKINRCTNTGNISVATDEEESGLDEYLLLAAGIVAKSANTVENCTNEGNITGFNAAGIVTHYVALGSLYGVKKCNNEGSVFGNNTAGGIVAYADAGVLLEQVENNASVTGAHRVGGIAGVVKNAELKYCTNTGPVQGTAQELKETYFAIGGICAANNGGNLTRCINAGPVTRLSQSGQYKFVGGVVGTTQGNIYNRGVLKDCSNTAAVTGVQDYTKSCYTGGFCGFFASGPKPEECYNTGTVNGEEPTEENEYGGHA